MAEIDDHTRRGLESLRQSVANALERKRRLGHYAVFWRDGRVVFEGPDAPAPAPMEQANPPKHSLRMRNSS